MPTLVRSRTLLAGLALAAALALPARADLAVECEWPPPGGPAVFPESTDVMMTPIVGDLDGDGLPEIVIVTFIDVNDPNRGEDGILRVLSGADCSEIWAVPDPGLVTCFGDAVPRSLDERADEGVFCPACGAAIADLDDDGDMEVVVMAEGQVRPDDAEPDDYTVGFPRRAVVFDHLGNFVSCTEASPRWLGHLAAPALGDLDADGEVEIVVRSTAWNADGSLRWAGPVTTGFGPSVVADLDEDGVSEVVSGETAYTEDGAILWDRTEDLSICFPAVADLTGDCLPEVVVTAPKLAEVHVLDGLTGATLASAPLPGGLEACPNPRPDQGGAPTLADLDGDLLPEIGVAGCLNYTVFRVLNDGMGNLTGIVALWTAPISDDSSRITASTFFDLEGDGLIEALYQDQQRLWIYDGLTGAVRDEFLHSNSTLIEYPALADVDADGQAEVVIVGSDYIRCCEVGIKVLSDPTQSWTPTRNLLNQHAYHQTNIEDDGRIPVREPSSWRSNNNYRAQLVPSNPQREDCALPPELVCGPGGPYVANCAVDPDCPGGVELVLEAEPSPEFGVGEVIHRWTIDCDGDVQVLEGLSVLACVPVSCGGCTVQLEVSAIDGQLSACDTEILWEFDEPPLTIEAGEYLEAECPPPAAEPPVVTAACGPAPVPELEQDTIPGPCPGTYTRIDRWFAVDDCGELVEDSRIVDVADTTPPVMDGLPEDLEADCAGPPDPPAVTATDDCSGAEVSFTEVPLPGDCPGSYTLLRTWTATDECGNTSSETRLVEVSDTTAPLLLGVPGDQTVPCDGVPDPAAPTAEDDCDPAPEVLFEETIVPGPCPYHYDVIRTWTAADACGNEVSASQTIEVRDLEPPLLVVPERLVLECDGDGGVALDDPRIQDWLASASATDDCTDPVVVSWDAPPFFPVGCPDPAPQVVTFFAQDECGNAVSASSTVEVVDTTPPEILSAELPGCLWSPNHMYACFPDVGELVVAVDACGGEVSVRVEGCSSDQPDEAPESGDRGGREMGNGDGHHFDDCLVAPDGSGVCVRYERQGTDEEGRHYGISLVVEDACGNAATVPWDLFVPHDQREHPCPNAKRSEKVGPNDPFPWED